MKFQFFGQNWAKDIKNGSIHAHGSYKSGKWKFQLKNIDKSVKNMQKASKLIFWPKLHIYSKITETNNQILYFRVNVIDIRAKTAFFRH